MLLTYVRMNISYNQTISKGEGGADSNLCSGLDQLTGQIVVTSGNILSSRLPQQRALTPECHSYGACNLGQGQSP